MTTPGGVPNLPMGALTLDTIADKLHDTSPEAMRGRAGDRMPSIFHSSMGGDPMSDYSLFGWLMQLWAGFNSAVANADPADITGPEDLPGLLVNFIEELPIIGEVIELVKSIISGDFDAADVLTTIENVFNTLGSMLGLGAPDFDVAAVVEWFAEMLMALPGLLSDLASELIGGGFGIMGSDSPLNALNLFNLINPNLLGQLPFSHIGDVANQNVNLLANPTFHSDKSVQGSELWFWDGATGRTTPGSATTVAEGAERKLVSNAVPVSEGQKLDLSIYSKWSGLAYTGTPIKLQVVRMLDYATVGVDDLDAPASPAADQVTWLQLGDEYTVPAGCDMICLQLNVTDTATSGTVWFDEGDIHKTGSESSFVPFWNVTGIGGPENIGATAQATWDRLISGLVGELDDGATLGDLFNISLDVSSWASKGRMGWDILGIRNNRSMNSGFLPTTQSNIGLDKIALQASAPTFGITQSTAITSYERISAASDYRVVSWQGYGTTNVTDCYINIYKMNLSTGVNDLVHASTNQVGLLTGGSVPVPVVYTLPTAIPVEAGEVYGVEIAIRGAGTHNIAGASSWLQDQPVYPRRYSSVRNSGTSPAPASFTPTYGSNVPFVEFGVSAGDIALPRSPVTNTLNVAGSASIAVPSWVNYIDVIALGAGGAGGNGAPFGWHGEGGDAGAWATGTWVRDTDFSGALSVSVTVGAGTATGDGGNTAASITGHTVTANGGDEGANGATTSTTTRNGDSPGNQTYNGVVYVGGGTQSAIGAAGSAPGGGGSGGKGDSGSQPGGPGAAGAVWLVFRQT